MQNGQFPEIIKLTDLNGQNGFKIDGENNDDHFGDAVSEAGDMNGDDYADLLIEARGCNNYNGCSYVIFGDSRVGSSGTIALSNLNGHNGFKLVGETSNNCNGAYSIGAGDIMAMVMLNSILELPYTPVG